MDINPSCSVACPLPLRYIFLHMHLQFLTQSNLHSSPLYFGLFVSCSKKLLPISRCFPVFSSKSLKVFLKCMSSIYLVFTWMYFYFYHTVPYYFLNSLFFPHWLAIQCQKQVPMQVGVSVWGPSRVNGLFLYPCAKTTSTQISQHSNKSCSPH